LKAEADDRAVEGGMVVILPVESADEVGKASDGEGTMEVSDAEGLS
jgi:hypothetical protein